MAFTQIRPRWGQVLRRRAGLRPLCSGTEAESTGAHPPLPGTLPPATVRRQRSRGRPSPRLITRRCTSLVPSPISRILASR